ncbi:MAG: hypothetical protein LQ341_003269 [Variospora aurantia]|nr:MAG: hypothetical protein LQ341_003269 [Variospora aurantia]
MASMSSEESKPRSVMSRSKESGRVVSGGRSLKYRRVTSWPPGHHSGWPTTAEASPSPEQPTKRQKRKRVPPTGLPPDPDTEKDPSNISYKAVYEAKMQEIYGSDSDIEDELAKHAALKSTPTFPGLIRYRLLTWSGKNAIIKYCSKPLGWSMCMKTPRVASDACSRKTASPASLATSMGMERRWQAKMVLVRGMYCAEREPVAERIRMWDVSDAVADGLRAV